MSLEHLVPALKPTDTVPDGVPTSPRAAGSTWSRGRHLESYGTVPYRTSESLHGTRIRGRSSGDAMQVAGAVNMTNLKRQVLKDIRVTPTA